LFFSLRIPSINTNMSDSSEAQVSPQLQQFIMQEQAKAQVICLI
jgi:hypothetical protein